MVSNSGLFSAGSTLTDITFLEPDWKISAFHSIKAVVSQVGALLKLMYHSDTVGLR